MNAKQMLDALRPFGRIVDPKGVAVKYRCINLSPTAARACSINGLMERKVKLGVNGTCNVNGATLIAVIDSLQGYSGEEVELKVSDSSLSWKCGPANGRLATVSLEDNDIPRITRRAVDGWKPGADFVKALRFGAISCDDRALGAMQMYGVPIDLRSPAAVYSSDNTTISSCRFEPPKGKGTVLCLAPEAVDVLQAVIAPGAGSLEMDEDGAFYRDATTQVVLPACAPIKHDLRKVCDGYPAAEKTVSLPRAAIGEFVARVNAMTQQKRFAKVTILAEKGKLALSFSEDTAESAEFILLDKGTKVPPMKPVQVLAGKLARALSVAEQVAFDYVDRHVLLLIGVESNMRYLIQGSQAG